MTTIEKAKRAGKWYTLKSSAARAAKEDGFKQGEFEIKKGKKGYCYQPTEDAIEDAILADMEAAAAEQAAELEEAEPDLIPEYPVMAPTDPKPAKEAAKMVQQYEPAADKAAAAIKAPKAPAAPKAEPKPKRHLSEVEGPTKLVWNIAEQMREQNPAVTRKEIMAACEKAGIAYYTARTQIQQWYVACRNGTK